MLYSLHESNKWRNQSSNPNKITKKGNLFYDKKHSSISEQVINAHIRAPPSIWSASKPRILFQSLGVGRLILHLRGESSLINLPLTKMKISKTYICIYTH